jgi:signal transduction histidine kinase
MKGSDKGRRFELADGREHIIGREGDFALSDTTVSRRHAQFIPKEDRWYILDLHSNNGTFVNGIRVFAHRPLNPGDQIRTGETIFVFGIADEQPLKLGVRVATKEQIQTRIQAMIPSDTESVIFTTPERGRDAMIQLRVVYGLTELIGSIDDRKQLLERVMDLVFTHFKPDRGFILLQDSPTERPEPVVIRHRAEQDSGTERWITVSRKIVRHVMKHREGVLSSNVTTDPRFSDGNRDDPSAIRSAICVPIKFKDRLFGVIHADTEQTKHAYTHDQLRLLTAIGAQTGVALANLQNRDTRIERERFAAVGETVASLSHSIRNILQGLRGGAEVVDLGLRKDNLKLVQGGWDVVSRNLERIYQLTMNMLAFSKQRNPELETTNLRKLIEELADLVQAQYDAKKATLVCEIDPQIPAVPVDPGAIHQAVLNLLNNALEVVPAVNGRVILRCLHDDHAHQIRIIIADNGGGMPPEIAKRLFEPFYSTKGIRGTGLGLVVAKKVVEEHNGQIIFETVPGQGTTFTITLPIKAAPAPDSTQQVSTQTAEDTGIVHHDALASLNPSAAVRDHSRHVKPESS